MEESLGLGKKSSGPKTDTETLSWFRLPIPKPGFGRTLLQSSCTCFLLSFGPIQAVEGCSKIDKRLYCDQRLS